MDPSLQDHPFLCSESTEVSLLAANDPVFADLKADDFKAYVRFRLATAFPAVIGPEMHGRYFGFHPQVLVASYRSLLHQQTNLGHMLKSYGAYRDRIVGNVVGVSVANLQRSSKQAIAATANEAQYLDVVAVLYKAAEGVKDFLGNHASARQKQNVSIEVATKYSDLWVYDPRDRSILTTEAAAAAYPKLFSVHKERGIQIGKVDNVQFAFAAGGEGNPVPFRGVGYTPQPAEGKTARIIDLHAASDDICFAALAMPEWEPGCEVQWQRIHALDAGQGTVMEVITEGVCHRHGMHLIATVADPLLDIRVHGKNLHVLRHAGSVAKRAEK